MICFFCKENKVVGLCHYCSRAVCEKHANEGPNQIAYSDLNEKIKEKGFNLSSLWCGACVNDDLLELVTVELEIDDIQGSPSETSFQCPSCGYQIDNYNYCPNCGYEITEN